MKTFLEEYGLIIVAILVVGALIALAIFFSGKVKTESQKALNDFQTKANQSIEEAKQNLNGTDGSNTKPNTKPNTEQH